MSPFTLEGTPTYITFVTIARCPPQKEVSFTWNIFSITNSLGNNCVVRLKSDTLYLFESIIYKIVRVICGL